MTHYEKVRREEIARRNYSEGTTCAYLRVLHDLDDYFQRPPESLTPDQIRVYTAHLVSDRKLSGNTSTRSNFLVQRGFHDSARPPDARGEVGRRPPAVRRG